MGSGIGILDTKDENLICELRTKLTGAQAEEYAEFRALNLPRQNYGEYSLKMKTGDILLFKCMCQSSTFLKNYQGCPYSHVGVVVVRKNVPYVFESSFSEFVVDADRGVCVNGPMISQLSKRLNEFYGIICWRALEVPNRNDELMDGIMEKLVQDFSAKYYDHSLSEYYKAFQAKSTKTGSNTSHLFCSELVAECYQHLGLLSSERASNSFSVADFTESGYDVTSITQFRNLSPEDAKVQLLEGGRLLGSVILNPSWPADKLANFDISTMTEEDLHIFSGVGISTGELLRRTDATLHIILDSNGSKLHASDDGLVIDTMLESLLKPKGLRVSAVVGEVPFDIKIGIPHFQVTCLENEQVSIPVILGEENLLVWLWVYDDDIFSSSDCGGMIGISPKAFLDVREKSDTPQKWKMQGGQLSMYVWLTIGAM